MPPAISLKQFRAWITSGGETLKMYAPVISKQTSTVSCFIAAEAGQVRERRLDHATRATANSGDPSTSPSTGKTSVLVLTVLPTSFWTASRYPDDISSAKDWRGATACGHRITPRSRSRSGPSTMKVSVRILIRDILILRDDAEPLSAPGVVDTKRQGQIVLKIRRIVRVGGHELNPIISVPKQVPGAKKNSLCVKFVDLDMAPMHPLTSV